MHYLSVLDNTPYEKTFLEQRELYFTCFSATPAITHFCLKPFSLSGNAAFPLFGELNAANLKSAFQTKYLEVNEI